jgi:hypothetical protein
MCCRLDARPGLQCEDQMLQVLRISGIRRFEPMKEHEEVSPVANLSRHDFLKMLLVPITLSRSPNPLGAHDLTNKMLGNSGKSGAGRPKSALVPLPKVYRGRAASDTCCLAGSPKSALGYAGCFRICSGGKIPKRVDV